VIAIGDRAPEFDLADTDGEPQAFETPAVVIFTSNHCPYALAWHDRLMQVARDYVDVHFYAINPNDAERYPDDSFEAMKERVRADEGWPMPYMHDRTQEVARAYGARTTPDVFVLDSNEVLRYRGAPDADHRDPTQNASWLREALDSMLAGEEIARPETDPVGCSVKWR
jgi:thioredoxin-related protein